MGEGVEEEAVEVRTFHPWTVILDRRGMEYDGSQLRRAFIHERYGVQGKAILVVRGPMNVSPENTVDTEDIGSRIKGDDVLHILVDDPTVVDPIAAGLQQRLLVSVTKEILESATGKTLRREGDDLFFDDRKLTVSVFKPAGPGSLIHLGINVTTEGVPVEASSLRDLGYRGDPLNLGYRVARSFASEMEALVLDATKMRW